MNTELDPLSPAFAADPYRFYAALRQQDRPPFSAALGMVLLSRYEDICAVAGNPAMLRSLADLETPQQKLERQRAANWHDMPYHERVVQFSLLDSDGEIHRRLRNQIFGEFTTGSVARLEPVVRVFVNDLLDRFADRQEIDFVEDFAAHVPGFVIGHLLGAPAADARQLRVWSEQVVQFFDVDRSDARKALAETATRDFYHYLEDLRDQRARSPREDLISKMIVDQQAGLYTKDEFISTCMLILMAGHGSTIDVLGSGMHTLLRHPAALATLRRDYGLIPNAIQEMFRFEPPLPFFHRHATQAISLRGHEFPKGTTFGLLYGAANRDPLQFEEPDVFNIHRRPNRHLAFGFGAHLCLGNKLALLNMKVIFESLFERYSTIELLRDDIAYKPGLSVRGPLSLPVRLVGK